MNKFVISSVAALALVAGASSANGQTVAELQALIASLQSQIAALAGTTTTTTVTSSYVNPGVTLRVGSKGVAVTALQNALNNLGFNAGKADGIFGNGTAAAVRAFQASKGLGADGVAGNQTHGALTVALSGTTTVPTVPGTSTGTLQGGAGDIEVSTTSTGVKSAIKEASSENILGLDVEAEGSDVSLTNVRVSFTKANSDGSSRFDRYFDEIAIVVDGKEVGSVDAADFTKSGSTYSRNITLSNAVIKSGKEVKVYVKATTLNSVNNIAATWDVAVESIRFTDATGAILTVSDASTPAWVNSGINFRAAEADDKLTVRTSTKNPKATTLKVDADDISEEYLIGAFRLEAGNKSSDLAISTLNVSATLDNHGLGALNKAKVESIVNRLWIEIDGEEFEAKYNTVSSDTVSYTVDVNESVTVEAGDILNVEIFAEFKEQDDNYDVGTTIKVAVAGSSIEFEGEDTKYATSSFTDGATHTLTLGAVEVTNVTTTSSVANNATKPGYISFQFTVKAVDEDAELALADIVKSVSGPTPGIVSAGTLSKVSGNATVDTGVWTITEGSTSTFVLDYVVTPAAGADNGTYRVTLESVLGVELDKVSSPVQVAN